MSWWGVGCHQLASAVAVAAATHCVVFVQVSDWRMTKYCQQCARDVTGIHTAKVLTKH